MIITMNIHKKGLVFLYCSKCGKAINDFSKFCEFCNSDFFANEIQNTSDISRQTVIEHLELAGMLEKRIYEINVLIQNISCKIKNLQTIKDITKEHADSLINLTWLWIFPISWIIISLFLVFTNEEHPIIAILLLYYSIFPLLGRAATISAILTAIPIILHFIVNLINTILIEKRYNETVKKRDWEYKENIRKAEILEKEKENLIHKKEDAERYLNQVYEKNILFPKYRNIIAVLTIQEYFMSGRCNCLTGHEGAYNIYESELRQNLIINSLENIQYVLEQIKQNQYMLYQAIQDSQDKISELTYEFSNISSSLTTLEDNSKISTYNSKIAAENTQILSYIALSR